MCRSPTFRLSIAPSMAGAHTYQTQSSGIRLGQRIESQLKTLHGFAFEFAAPVTHFLTCFLDALLFIRETDDR